MRAISNSKVVHVIDRGDWVPVFSVEGGWAHIGHNRKVYSAYLVQLSEQESRQLENEIWRLDKKRAT